LLCSLSRSLPINPRSSAGSDQSHPGKNLHGKFHAQHLEASLSAAPRRGDQKEIEYEIKGTPHTGSTLDRLKPATLRPQLNGLFRRVTKLAGAGGTKGHPQLDVAVADKLLKIDEICKRFSAAHQKVTVGIYFGR
jgi:hypothetical protein